MKIRTALPRTIASLVALLLIGVASSGCDSSGDLLKPPGEDIEVVLENDPSNGLPIHILGPGEDFAPSNRLAPGEHRTIRVRVDTNDTPGFQAGRNGNVLAGSACENRGFGTGFVVWIDGQLECHGSLAVVGRF